MFFITSPRLKLVPLDNYHLSLLQKSRADLENALGLQISNQLVDKIVITEMQDALDNYWLPSTAENPENYIWYTSWEIIVREENISIGGIGFIGLPDKNGQTMVGYYIDGNRQKNGFASEALECMCSWAFQNPEVLSIIAETYPDNVPSQKVLLKNGFKIIGSDDEMLFFKLTR